MPAARKPLQHEHHSRADRAPRRAATGTERTTRWRPRSSSKARIRTAWSCREALWHDDRGGFYFGAGAELEGGRVAGPLLLPGNPGAFGRILIAALICAR